MCVKRLVNQLRRGRSGQRGDEHGPRNRRRERHFCLALIATLAVIAGVAGCGGDSPRPVAVRVGEVSISSGTVSHWAKAIGLGKEVASSLGQSHGTARERALDFLISTNWLIGEAAEQGLAVSDATIEHRLQERIEAVPNGKSEFEEEIASTKQTTADVKLEIKDESAAALLRAMVSKRVRPVTQADIADYYRHNRTQFHVPDLRSTDLIESIHGARAFAIALGERIGPGRRFAKMSLHEMVARETPFEEAHRENGELVRTIFTAAPGKVAGPVWFNHAWVLIVVRKVVPGRFKRLAEVREAVAARLTSQRRRLALLSFIKTHRSKWIARTDCSPGFVVQKCAQYRGPTTPEGNPLLSR